MFGGNQTSDSSLIQGIRYALDQGADVINMSLGGPCDHTESGQECGGPLDYFIQRAVDQCAYGSTLQEYMGPAAEKFPPPVRDFINASAAEQYERRTGRIFAPQTQRLEAQIRQLAAGRGESA